MNTEHLKTLSALDTGEKAGKLSGTSPQVSQAHFFHVREVNWPKESGWFGPELPSQHPIHEWHSESIWGMESDMFKMTQSIFHLL